jgi:GNAT superfamily N-acetyltransferase
MAKRYNLHHWDNSHIKNWIIIALCAMKNRIYLVYADKTPVATFQTRKTGQSYLFQKLATSPEFAGGGIGTFCLNQIERLAKSENCKEVVCEVYDKSEHAKTFYQLKGYVVYGETDTLKYKELKLRKEL